jgi:hypothetical protein
MLEVAEDRSKLALVDLIRLLLLSDTPAVHILNGHWETFDVSLFQYLQCLDIKDPADKVTQNYHLISLKMLANVYQTKIGIDFVSNVDCSRQIISFCEYSFDSCSPKAVFTAGVVLFNHLLSYLGELDALAPELYSAIFKICERLEKVEDEEARKALLLAATRMLYKNQTLLDKMQDGKDKFVKAMNEFKSKPNSPEVR